MEETLESQEKALGARWASDVYASAIWGWQFGLWQFQAQLARKFKFIQTQISADPNFRGRNLLKSGESTSYIRLLSGKSG